MLSGNGDTRNARSVCKDNAKAKVCKQAIPEVSDVLKRSPGAFYSGSFRVEIEIHGKCRADIDNVGKGILDALNGVAYKDDRECVGFSVKLCKSKGYL